MKWPFGKNTKTPVKAALPGNTADDPVLNKHSDTWKFIKKFLEEDLQKLREQNDKVTLDAEKTAAIRGQIKEVKRILNLENERPGGLKLIRSEGLGTEIFGPGRNNG